MVTSSVAYTASWFDRSPMDMMAEIEECNEWLSGKTFPSYHYTSLKNNHARKSTRNFVLSLYRQHLGGQGCVAP